MNSDPSFPNESDAYRAARARLLAAEAELREAVERVAAQRRALPLGGRVTEDYAFETLRDGQVASVRLSELFDAGRDSLFLYSWMFGPEMPAPCPSCTCFLDSLDRQARHLRQRINVAVVAQSPIQRLAAQARALGWRELRVLSSRGTTYARDYWAETPSGAQMPMAHVFVRRGDAIHHSWGSELLYGPRFESGHPRHIDMMWPLWNVLDTTPDGRGGSWGPRLSYD